MITFKRALLVACALLGLFLLLRTTRFSQPPALGVYSPTPTGLYDNIKKLQQQPPPPDPNRKADTDKPTPSPSPATTSSTSNIDTSGRIALAKKPSLQLALNDLKAQPLRKQLAYTFPYDSEGKFPAYIWQTWRYSPAQGEFKEDLRPAEASWTELHPTFVHEVITDAVAAHLIRHLYAGIPEVYQAYDALPRAVLKADFFRYLILLARGGIYADIDTRALKSAVEWVPADVPRSGYGLVVGIEADPDRPDWHEWYSRRIQFCQWTIQSKPGHPILADVVASITEETMRRKADGSLSAASTTMSIIEFTGPAVWTDAIFRFFNNPDFFDMTTSKGNITWHHFTGITQAKKVGDVVVLPITSFSPGVGQMGAGEDDDPMAFVKHNFEGTWKPENERHISGEDPDGQWH